MMHIYKGVVPFLCSILYEKLIIVSVVKLDKV